MIGGPAVWDQIDDLRDRVSRLQLPDLSEDMNRVNAVAELRLAGHLVKDHRRFLAATDKCIDDHGEERVVGAARCW